MMNSIVYGHNKAFCWLDRAADRWLLGLTARFVFAATLLVYYYNSAMTKVGEGLSGFFTITPSAYFQIVPQAVQAAGFNPANVDFFPYGLIVWAGTYAEFILPLLVVAGLLTRLASLGMIGFIVVQSYVDIQFHGVNEETIGGWFDAVQNSAIMDQRLLWVFVLLVLVYKGAGLLSLDGIFNGYHQLKLQKTS
jgi:putative oxidoreductase